MVKAFKNALHRATMKPLDKMIFFSILIWTKTILHELFACTIISKKSCDFLLGFYHEINSEMLI